MMKFVHVTRPTRLCRCKISARRSRVTGHAEQFEMVQYLLHACYRLHPCLPICPMHATGSPFLIYLLHTCHKLSVVALLHSSLHATGSLPPDLTVEPLCHSHHLAPPDQLVTPFSSTSQIGVSKPLLVASLRSLNLGITARPRLFPS